MPASSDVVRLNIECYRKQADELLEAARSGDPGAMGRLVRHSPESATSLDAARFTVAIEQGFSDWASFEEFLVQSKLDFQGVVPAFIEAALLDSRRAEEMLAAHPKIAGAGFYAALVLGDVDRVERRLNQISGIARAKGGPRDWEPLLYVCFSRFAGNESSRAGDFAGTARALLHHGADPNASYISSHWPDNPLPCLYGATGVNNNSALALVLLETGANPNDSESLYHSTEHADLECLRLLLEHGASPTGTNALRHMLDREDVQGLRLLLGAGADPNEVNQNGETALHWAVWRGRSTEVIAALLESGAEVDARRNDGRTAYAMSVHSGQAEVAELLEKLGANTELSALDRFLAASAATGASEGSSLPENLSTVAPAPGDERFIPDLAMSHRTSAVRALLAAGFPVDARGENGATALHWACWKGYADIVELLLGHGASLAVEDAVFHATPAGWFGHGVQNCPERGGGDYPRVASLLLAAGASIAACDMPTGHAAVDAVLREHGLIE